MNETRKKILLWVCGFIKDNGYSPSYAEIMEGCEYKSTSAIHWHVHGLRRDGFIEAEDEKMRSIKMTGKGLKFCNERGVK